MRMRRLAVWFACIVPLAACVKGSDSSSSPNPNAGFQAQFAPLGGLMPFPNDLYFSGTTTGTLNIPVLDPTQAANASILALNHLDGYGTQQTINVYFTSPVDATTLASNVFVIKTTSDPTTKVISGVSGVLVPGTDYSIGVSNASDGTGTVVNITPLKPLAGGTTYLVVVTTGVKDKNGDAATPSADYSAILAADAPALAAGNVAKIDNTQLPNVGLQPVAQFTFAQLAAGIPTIQAVTSNASFGAANIAVTFSFSTQYIGATMAALQANASPTAQPAGKTGIYDTGETVCQVLVAAGELPSTSVCAAEAPGSTVTEVFAGSVALPYYSGVPTQSATAPVTAFWHTSTGGDTTVLSPLPAPTVAQNIIPILAAVPLAGGPCTMPAGGWPVVIFQHGITRSREDMFAMASGFGGSCYAVVAIDLPLHGVTNTADPFYQNQLFAGTAVAGVMTGERTFNLDLENNTTLAPGPDGQIDPSGAWFINLSSTLTSRDNAREGAADLINLAATLPTLAAITPPATVNTFDGSKIYYVGHSLGAIEGTTFLGADSTAGSQKIKAAFLASPGGDLTQLLTTSVEFGPIINSGLAAQGVTAGTQFYYDFFRNAQAAVDDGDPANYAALAVSKHPIDMIEVVGGFANDPCNLPDQVVPNTATELLVTLMGLQTTTLSAGTGTTFVPGSTPIVRFLAGDHGSILSPAAPSSACSADALLYAGVTQEMQTEMVSFIESGGTAVQMNNTYGFIK